MSDKVEIFKYGPEVPDDILARVLEIKTQYLLNDPGDAKKHPNGFLVGTLDAAEILGFLKTGGFLYLATVDSEIAAYLLLTDIREFFGYFSTDHSTETSKHQESAGFVPLEPNIDIFIEMKNNFFIYHVATSPKFSRLGLGSQLLKRIYSDFPGKGFTADILIKPVFNETSISFFKKNGFHDVGDINYSGYKSFGDLTTRVLWKKP